MDFFEAMKMMKDGIRVKLKSWPKDRYIGIKEEDVKIFGKRRTKYSVINPEETDISPCMPFSALVSNEWEISTLD